MKNVTVSAWRLNFRDRPGRDSNVIGVLEKGEVLQVAGFSENCYWVKLVRSDGNTGWSAYKYLMGIPEPEHIRPGDYRWLKIAYGELDTAELSDPGENYRITQYLKTCEESLAAINENSDETAWCSAFMNWCVEHAGYAGTNSAWALNWQHWGQEADARRGVIAVFKRFVTINGQRHTFGHVGFYLGADPDRDGHVLILGGNQSNRVKVSSYPARSSRYELLGFRRAAATA